MLGTAAGMLHICIRSGMRLLAGDVDEWIQCIASSYANEALVKAAIVEGIHMLVGKAACQVVLCMVDIC